MLAPQRQNVARRPVAVAASTPAPVGGWNARDGYAEMDPSDAVVLDNFFPDTASVNLRRGYTEHVTGFSDPIESLMAWHGPADSELYAAAGDSIFEATAPGAVGSAVQGSLNNARWQHTMFGTSGGNFLYIVNGENSARYYDGTSWTTPTINNVTSSTLVHVNVFKRRLFFCEVGSLSTWYFPVETIAGDATEFRFDGLARRGGHLQAMGTWSRDGGDGLDDLAVFVTSHGEAIIYQGTDPGSASTWALVGVFEIGAPIGRRCMIKVGGELVVITEDGYVPISGAIAGARTTELVALSDKIRGAVSAATRDLKGNFGWQPILYPRGNYALFNVPVTENTVAEQHVMNTTTRAWCRFTGMEANCWETFSENLYFGGATAVYLADSGTDDDGANIDGAAKTAFSYLGRKGIQKRFTMARPVVATEGQIRFALSANVDFEDRAPTSAPTYSGTAGAEWDAEDWNVADWATSATVKREWQAVDGVGYSVALSIKTSQRDIGLMWYSTDWLYEPGGYL